MLHHDELTEKMLANPDVKEAYDGMTPEFALLDDLLRAREAAVSQSCRSFDGSKYPLRR